MSETRLIPINDLVGWLGLGHRYPGTVDQFRTLYRNRRQNGLDGAFVRVGNRVLVDESKFIEAVRAKSAAAA